MDSSMEHAIITFGAALLANLAVGMDVRAEYRALRDWAHALSDHLGFKRPAPVKPPRKD